MQAHAAAPTPAQAPPRTVLHDDKPATGGQGTPPLPPPVTALPKTVEAARPWSRTATLVGLGINAAAATWAWNNVLPGTPGALPAVTIGLPATWLLGRLAGRVTSAPNAPAPITTAPPQTRSFAGQLGVGLAAGARLAAWAGAQAGAGIITVMFFPAFQVGNTNVLVAAALLGAALAPLTFLVSSMLPAGGSLAKGTERLGNFCAAVHKVGANVPFYVGLAMVAAPVVGSLGAIGAAAMAFWGVHAAFGAVATGVACGLQHRQNSAFGTSLAVSRASCLAAGLVTQLKLTDTATLAKAYRLSRS